MFAKRCSWIVGAGVVAALGCGGSSTKSRAPDASADAGHHVDAGHKADAGNALPDAGSPPKITPLTDNSAGKACTSDEPCGGGTCSMTVMTSGSGLNGLIGGAMSSSAPGGYCTGPCLMDSDCGAGGSCVGAGGGIAGIVGGLINGMMSTMPGQCQASCKQNSDCRDGYSCGVFMVPTGDGGMQMPMAGGLGALLGGATTCQPLPGADQLDDHEAGNACATNGDCHGGSCALSMTGAGLANTVTTYPDGYCTGRCLSDANCGAGGLCFAAAGASGAGVCYEACASDTDCTRDGYRCRVLAAGVKACIPGAKPLADGVVGQACKSDDACGGGMGSCVTSLPAANAGGLFGGGAMNDPAPGGYCSNACVDDSDCGSGGACVGATMNAFLGDTLGACFKTCATSDDCKRSDYGCELRNGTSATGAASRINVCVAIAGEDAGR